MFYQSLGPGKAKKIGLAVGIVEGFREISPEESSFCGDSVRQVPCDTASWESLGYGAKAGISKGHGEGQKVHQGTKIYAFVASRKSDTGRADKFEASVGREQETEYGVYAEGIVWTALGLRDCGLGEKVLCKLPGVSEVAEVEALPRVRCND